MRALAAAGDVTGAIRQAGIHAGFLRSEFGDGPDPGVEALAERLRHGRVTAAAAQPVPRADPPAAVVDTTPVTAPAEQRPGRSRRIALAAVAVLLALVTIAWVRAARKPALEPRRVAVAPFENGTGDPALDALGGMVADWVVDGLVRTGLVEVVPVATSIGVAGRSAPGGGGGDVVRALSVGTGARFVVHGTFYRVDGRLHLQGRISDAGRGVVVRALGPFVAEQNLPLPALDSLRQQALVGLAPFVDSRLEATATAASAPPSFPAYRNYADGLEAFVAGELDRAIDRFDRAVALDSGYTHARVWAALARWNSGDHAGADSVIRTVDTTGAPLAPLDEAIRRSVLAWAAGDWAAAYEMAVRGARATPGSGLAAAQTAVEARRLGRPAEARRTLAALDPDRGDLRGWIYYWQDLAEARHLLGDHRAEWRDAEEARRRYPDHEATRLIQLRALAALGRGEAVTSVLEQVRTGAVERFFGRLSREAAAELLVHGHPEAAARVVEDGVRWYRERSGGSPSAAQILGLVRLMMVLPGNDQEAWALLAPTPPPENPRSAVDHAGLAALLAQRVGDEAGASERLQRIGALEVPMLNGRDEWWISAVLATRGDCRAAVASLARARSRGVEYGIELHNAAELTALRRCEGAGRVLGAVD